MREAVLSVSDRDIDSLGIGDLVSLTRAAGLEDFEELACEGSGALVQVEVESRVDEGRLDGLEYVEEWDHDGPTDDRATHLYRIAFTTPGVPEDITEHTDDLVGTCDPDLSDEGATWSLTGPLEAISGTVDGYETVGVSPDLRRLDAYEGETDPLDGLTERQREVIETAWDMGYYEVPKDASTEDVAASLDLDGSTVAEHLQRAERNLLAEHLKPE
jgi:hypothetical protein